MSTPPPPHLSVLTRAVLTWTVGRALGSGVGMLLVVALLAMPAGAQTTAVSGVVLSGTTQEPVADVAVALVTTEAGEAVVLAEAVSADDGVFVFDDAPRDTEVEVVASYADAAYRSGPFLATADGDDDVEVLVYETTEDPGAVRISNWVVWVDRDAGVTIQQDLQVENDSDLTWLGGAPDADGSRAVLTVPLHPGAEGLGFLGRFTECCATMRGTSYVHTSPLLPGRTMGTVRYSVETLEALELPADLPVESFTLMLPPGVELTDARVGTTAELTEAGTATTAELTEAGQIESRGTEYTVHTAADLAAGDVVRLGFRGLDDGSTPLWRYAVSAAAGLLVVAGAVWWMVRRRRPSAAAAVGGAGEAGGADGAGGAGRADGAEAGRSAAHERSNDHAPASRSDTGAVLSSSPTLAAPTPVTGRAALPPETLIEELALLDLGVERGLVSRDVYEQLRGARLAELLEQTATAGR